MPDIAGLITQHQKNPGDRKAQHLLASEVIELVHGPEEAAKTRAEHQAMRNPTLASLSQTPNPETEPGSAEQTTPSTQRIKLSQLLVYNTPFARILYHAGFVATKSEGARLIAKGGVYVASGNDEGKFTFTPIQAQQVLQAGESLVHDGLLILRLGKWKVRVIEVVEDGASDGQGTSDITTDSQEGQPH